MTLPEKMRAMVLTGHGGYDKLEYREDYPTPKAEPGEAVLKVHACGLNNTDINLRTGWYSKQVTGGITDSGVQDGFGEADEEEGSWSSKPVEFPRIQGADVCGTVVAVGDGVDEALIGKRALLDPWLLAHGDFMKPGETGYFGAECDGGYADYTKIRAANVYPIECDLSHAELATFACVITTAENLVARTNLQPGEKVVIAGASGGVGSIAIQLCKIRGAKVVAIAGKSKFDLVKNLGADAVVDRNDPKLSKAIQEAAGGEVDVALDVVGGALFNPMIDALRQYGRYSSSGAIAGPIVEFDLRKLVYKDLQMTGATIVPPGNFARLVRLIEQGKIKPVLAKTFPLKELVAAQEMFQAKGHVGNIVVTMDD